MVQGRARRTAPWGYSTKQETGTKVFSADRSDKKKSREQNRAEQRAEDRAELGAAMLWIRNQNQWIPT
jgi:hypothetical protein